MPNPEENAKTALWSRLENIVTIQQGELTDAQVYRLLTDFAEAHRPK